MKNTKKKILAGLLGAALLTGTAMPLTVQAAESDGSTQMLYTAPGGKPLAKADVKAAAQKKEKPSKIVINLAARSLTLFRGNDRVALYPIGPGKPSTPTPTGYYKIQEKIVNPTWTSPHDPTVSIPSGPDCPIGYRWMTIQGNYGIHGTNHPESIGTYASNGCVRMLEEDVEQLFDNVQVGTPVEITYNRIVVEKTDDNQVAYYIYPDGYGWQNVSVDDVKAWLKGYGVSDFESDEAIEKKIEASDGEPTYIAKVYPLFVNGKKMKGKAVVQDGRTYLPAVQLAETTKISLGWNADAQELLSSEGKAAGYDKKDTLYCDATDAGKLFHLQGALAKDGTYTMKSTGTEAAAAQATQAAPAEPQVPVVEMKADADAQAKASKKEKKSQKAEKNHVKTLQEIEAEATKH